MFALFAAADMVAEECSELAFDEDEADETGVMVAFVEDDDEHVEVASEDLALDRRLGLASGKPIVDSSFEV